MWHGFWKLTLLNRTAEYFYQCQSIGQTNSQSKKDGLQILCLIWHGNIYLHNIMLHRTCDLAICIQFNINLSKIHIRHTSDFYLGFGSHSAIRICKKTFKYLCATGFFFGWSNNWQKVQFNTDLLKQRLRYLYRKWWRWLNL
jgi:hypothetical protein